MFISESEVAGIQRFSFTFSSDNLELPLPSIPVFPDDQVTETGGAQLFDILRFSEGNPGIIVNLTSDIDPAKVPEPATLALVGLGLAGMGLSRRRHLRKS